MQIPGGKGALLALVLLLVGGAAGAGTMMLLDDDGGGDAATATTTTLSTTTTTVAVTSTIADISSTTTTTRPRTSTTTGATTTTAAGATTTTTAGSSSGACGTGKAGVSFTAKDLVTDAISSAFTPQATVDNQVNQPIEVEAIEIQVVYPGGDTRTVSFSTSGTVIGPGTSASFTADRLATARRYDSVKFTRFAYFTQGRRTDCRVST